MLRVAEETLETSVGQLERRILELERETAQLRREKVAAEAASDTPVVLGRVGAGTGATIAKWRGRDAATPGGLGGAVARNGSVIVAALMAVNASGEIFMTHTSLAGRIALRLSIGNLKTTQADVDRAWAALNRAAASSG